MNPNEPCQFVESFHDQFLIGDQLDEFIVHLQGCERCRRELVDLQTIERDLAAAWSQVSLPIPKVQRANQINARQSDHRRRWAVLTAMLIFILASAAFTVFVSRTPDGQAVNSNHMNDEVKNEALPNTLIVGDEIADEPSSSHPKSATIETRNATYAKPLARTETMTVYSVFSRKTY